MPASDQTAYPMKLLHRLFALASLALLATTVWLLVKDHQRPVEAVSADGPPDRRPRGQLGASCNTRRTKRCDSGSSSNANWNKPGNRNWTGDCWPSSACKSPATPSNAEFRTT